MELRTSPDNTTSHLNHYFIQVYNISALDEEDLPPVRSTAHSRGDRQRVLHMVIFRRYSPGGSHQRHFAAYTGHHLQTYFGYHHLYTQVWLLFYYIDSISDFKMNLMTMDYDIDLFHFQQVYITTFQTMIYCDFRAFLFFLAVI